ncbi:unnamed protein product [Rotaria socialis]|uniref:Uncharacterized protein n=1 Tax=Rotaria socialis TaxID=392032 RepID=A0A820YMB3_9BILA|nr:unnamed protein product [Rotaria socialis]CAF3551343.1 unnamed protein product [Rotaria socialis]CAF3607597.1 unnamed protein product [Rotaria socialis]CAF4550085.1 unnamed protein product [Rotaria socialis]CAF4572275.1 unnamed protein product [Rotaria socialis]
MDRKLFMEKFSRATAIVSNTTLVGMIQEATARLNSHQNLLVEMYGRGMAEYMEMSKKYHDQTLFEIAMINLVLKYRSQDDIVAEDLQRSILNYANTDFSAAQHAIVSDDGVGGRPLPGASNQSLNSS